MYLQNQQQHETILNVTNIPGFYSKMLIKKINLVINMKYFRPELIFLALALSFFVPTQRIKVIFTGQNSHNMQI